MAVSPRVVAMEHILRCPLDWVLLGIWWCKLHIARHYRPNLLFMYPVIFQQPRPGPSLPKGEHYLTIGWKQVCVVV